MREILLDKNFRRSKILLLLKILLVASLIIFFLPLIILPFFNYASANDYLYNNYLHQSKIFNNQSSVNNFNERFATAFITSLFAYNNYLYSHYYLPGLLLLSLNFLSLFTITYTIYKFIVKENKSVTYKLLFAFILLALEICCLPERSSFLFWFTGAITYQLPVILIQFEIALFIVLVNSTKVFHKSISAILILLLAFITIGLNELFIAVQFCILILILFFKSSKQAGRIFLLLFIILCIFGALLFLFSIHNNEALDKTNSKGIFVGGVSVVYSSLLVMWNILKTPFVWLAITVIFAYANRYKEKWITRSYLKKIAAQQWIILLFILFFIFAAVSIEVILLKGDVVPAEYLNAVTCILILLLLGYSFVAGILFKSNIVLFNPLTRNILITSLLIAAIFCNNYIVDAYKSLIIAPVYNTILNEREATLKAAAGNKTAVVKSYNTSLSGLMHTKYSSTIITLKQLIIQKPPLLFYKDDLETEQSTSVLKRYYGLSSIIIKSKQQPFNAIPF